MDALTQIAELASISDEWNESWDHLSVKGVLSPDRLRILIELYQRCEAIDYELTLRLDNDPYDLQSLIALDPDSYLPDTWQIVIGKSSFIHKAGFKRDNGQVLLFFARDTFLRWANGIDPLSIKEPDFSKPTTILAHGIESTFGGASLWILPTNQVSNISDTGNVEVNLPSSESIHKLIHILSEQQIVRISPADFSLTWGDRDSEESAPFRLLYAKSLAACLPQDLYNRSGDIHVVLRGTKRLELPLIHKEDPIPDVKFLNILQDIVLWIFEERAETRHTLISDRLSIDIPEGKSLISGLKLYAEKAFKQARERYGFVILDRKDEYYKELRDIMKDVRTQADLYAAKVRTLVNTLLRDILGILILIGVGLIGKFDPNKLSNLSSTPQVDLFFKAFAIYFLLSPLFQLFFHWRDLHLSHNESKTWLSLTREYASEEELLEKFERPLASRRRTFWLASLAVLAVYFLFAYTSWNFPEIIN